MLSTEKEKPQEEQVMGNREKQTEKESVLKGVQPSARCREVAARGVRNLSDVADLMAAVMADVITGRMSPAAANKLAAETGKVLSGRRRKSTKNSA
jgi:hypothetical protein